MDTIFKTLRVKATTVFMRLRIYLCALKIPTDTQLANAMKKMDVVDIRPREVIEV
jgi:hypothetical protein